MPFVEAFAVGHVLRETRVHVAVDYSRGTREQWKDDDAYSIRSANLVDRWIGLFGGSPETRQFGEGHLGVLLLSISPSNRVE